MNYTYFTITFGGNSCEKNFNPNPYFAYDFLLVLIRRLRHYENDGNL